MQTCALELNATFVEKVGAAMTSAKMCPNPPSLWTTENDPCCLVKSAAEKRLRFSMPVAALLLLVAIATLYIW
jgi:hypothetical protein